MITTNWIGLRVAVLALGLAVASAGRASERGAARPEVVRIGMVNSLFRDTPEPMVMALMKPFGALMESQTGLKGQLVPAGAAESLGQQLAEDKVQLAVFHGFEFAWARQRYPELQPLMIAVNQKRHLRAHLVVNCDCQATGLADLKGRILAIPRRTREHCHLFLHRQCQECGQELSRLFAQITTPASAEEALDDLVDNTVQAAVIDGVALECYQRRKPARYTRLKTLHVSEVFPAGVVAYRQGALGEATLRRFREGMLAANRTPIGRQLMTLWMLTAFEPIPADYEETLANIVKTYPPPPPESK
jgi:ABC-type phosphate/phosphonate transport system substrate-binding protein